jgi:hypothetical protein
VEQSSGARHSKPTVADKGVTNANLTKALPLPDVSNSRTTL